ncbi:MAG: hypothetical protein Q9171_002952 [Xanthocarpia ochracea]
MGMFKDKCMQLLHWKKTASKDKATTTVSLAFALLGALIKLTTIQEHIQTLPTKQARHLLRKIRRVKSRLMTSLYTSVSTGNASVAGQLDPVQKSLDHTTEPTSTSESLKSPEQTHCLDQDLTSSEDSSTKQETGGYVSHKTEPSPEGVPKHHCAHITAEVLSPPDSPTPPNTSTGVSPVRYTSSYESTPLRESGFGQTPETSRSSQSDCLRTPKRSDRYLQDITPCAPLATAAEASGIFELSAGDIPERPNASLCLAQALAENVKPEKAEGPAEQPPFVTAEKTERSAGDRASVLSESSSGWERAMDSREQRFQSEMEDLREDHAAEVGEITEQLTNLKKEIEAARKRKSYVESLARKKIAKIHEEKDAEVAYYTGLMEASSSLMDEQLREKDAMIDRLQGWNITTSFWYSELKDEYEYQKVHVISPLQPEVTRLTALNLENEQKIRDQSSQISYLLSTQARIQESQPPLMALLEETYEQRDQYKADFENCSHLYEQLLRDLVAAQQDLNSKNQRLKEFNYDHDNDPHPTEAKDLLEKTREAYRGLEKRANECLLRERQARKNHDQDRKSWKLDLGQKQKKIDNLEGKISLLEHSNGRMIEEIERSIGDNHITDNEVEVHPLSEGSLRFLYEESKQTVEELRTHIFQQEAQIDCLDKENHHHKVTISLHKRMLEEKESEINDSRKEKLEADQQVEEIQSKSEERDTASAEELEKAVNDIDWLKAQNQGYQMQIQTMTTSDIPATIIEAHESEVQGLQQYISDLGAEIHHLRRQQQEHEVKGWHDATAAAGSEQAGKVLQLNWQNAQEEIVELKRDLALLHQGCDPQKFDIAKELQEFSDDYEILLGKLQASEPTVDHTKADVFRMRELACIMWRELRRSCDEHSELMEVLEQVAKEINETMDKYEDEAEGEEKTNESVRAEDDGLDYSQVHGARETAAGSDDTTAGPRGGATPFTNPISGLQHDHRPDPLVERHQTSSYRPGYTFAAPSSYLSSPSTRPSLSSVNSEN